MAGDVQRLRQAIARNIAALAAQREMPLRKLAQEAGISRQALYPVLRSEVSVSIDRLAKLAAVLQVDPKELLELDDRTP